MTDDPRRRLGSLGERLAAEHLCARGYAIVERNFRTRRGEIDLIAADRERIVFCEVKTRVSPSAGRGGIGPLDAIGMRKRSRLRRLAREWLGTRAAGTERPVRAELRFDAVGIVLDPAGRLLTLEHVEGAF